MPAVEHCAECDVFLTASSTRLFQELNKLFPFTVVQQLAISQNTKLTNISNSHMAKYCTLLAPKNAAEIVLTAERR